MKHSDVTRDCKDITGQGVMPLKILSATETGHCNNPQPNNCYDLRADATLSTDFINNRLAVLLNAARANGIVVQFTLFDAVAMRQTAYWPYNPWNPLNNNLNEIGVSNLDNLSNAFDSNGAFYRIHKDEAHPEQGLNKFGVRQKNYVISMVNAITSACNGPCRNVIFEIMNESPVTTGVSSTLYKNWHMEVANWIQTCGAFLVSASVGVGALSNDPTTTFSAYETALFDLPSIKVIALHNNQWNDGTEQTPQAVIKRWHSRYSNKTILIDDDGGGDVFGAGRCADLHQWAKITVDCPKTSVSGGAHYLHLNDTKTTGYVCNADNVDKKVDCNKLRVLASIRPTQMCGKAWFTCGPDLDECPGTCMLTCSTTCPP